jgi:hypothetical protein
MLYDETQKLVQAYRVACTTDFFVFDAARKLAYRGQFDTSRPGNRLLVTGQAVLSALGAVFWGNAVPATQKASHDCSFKWRAGYELNYARG